MERPLRQLQDLIPCQALWHLEYAVPWADMNLVGRLWEACVFFSGEGNTGAFSPGFLPHGLILEEHSRLGSQEKQLT